MKSKFKVNQTVNVAHETSAFKGVITAVLKWENPFSLLNKIGYDYHVKAEDDQQTYKVPEHLISNI